VLRRLLVGALLVSVFALMGADVAHAGGCPSGTTPVRGPGLGVICVPVHDPGQSGTLGTPGEEPSHGDSYQSAGCFNTDDQRVPCSTDLGVWFGEHQCYAAPYDAPAGAPAWQGHSDGSLSMCTSCDVAGNASTCNAHVLWVAPGAAPGPPDPAQMASDALGLLRLPAAEVHTAPQAPDHTYIGIENWLWVPSSQWATLTKTVTAGATQVTVTAVPDRIVWDMGPASTTCYGPGVEWRVGMTDAARTSCGFTYAHTSDSEPGGAFSVSATVQYGVDWVCSGACTSNAGTLGLIDAPAGTGTLTVLQRQTVVVQ
jgi:hypothetical protein